ncbi:hypothetical protein C2E23DRAFT_813904 [Lenzites betulinus]|nr:hypothetical protein C2E23DRAFT_813904 [Lenzites betulinus]
MLFPARFCPAQPLENFKMGFSVSSWHHGTTCSAICYDGHRVQRALCMPGARIPLLHSPARRASLRPEFASQICTRSGGRYSDALRRPRSTPPPEAPIHVPRGPGRDFTTPPLGLARLTFAAKVSQIAGVPPTCADWLPGVEYTYTYISIHRRCVT